MLHYNTIIRFNHIDFVMLLCKLISVQQAKETGKMEQNMGKQEPVVRQRVGHGKLLSQFTDKHHSQVSQQ